VIGTGGSGAIEALERDGFVVLPGFASGARAARLSEAYDAAVEAALPSDVRVGRTTTRVNDFVSRGPEFDELYVFPPLFEAAHRVIGGPFKLSSLHARTLRPGAGAQELHVDLERKSDAWPLVGFILMVDPFRPDNGATRFVPGSHLWTRAPNDADAGVFACGPAGFLIVFNGSAWHGHSANLSAEPRRSIQGAFIPRSGQAAMDWDNRVPPETLTRLGDMARYVLGVSEFRNEPEPLIQKGQG
jgi:ectoine hydroxylase-related dioxygenase (phytanoyl-CoA dioxygenase family)